MGSFSLGGTFTNLPDPDFQSYGPPLRGAFVGGGLVYQGWESGQLKFPPLLSAAYNELFSRWTGNMGGLVGGTLPALSAFGWDTVTAAWGAPVPTGFDGPVVHGVNMTVYRITRY